MQATPWLRTVDSAARESTLCARWLKAPTSRSSWLPMAACRAVTTGSDIVSQQVADGVGSGGACPNILGKPCTAGQLRR